VPGYLITGEIARGGMGVVYAARDSVLGREVAIKTLHPSLIEHPDIKFQFEREARITARLPHPCVPPIHSFGTLPDGRPYLTMKLIRGRTLAAILAARKALCSQSVADLDPTTPDFPGMLHVFEQVCQAVAFAHSQGIIHRDLKPQNIMVGPFGEVQVMDWGLARMLKTTGGEVRSDDSVEYLLRNRKLEGEESDSTRHGTTKGTPSYMPPEQARGDWESVDHRADVFALGGLLCVILTGSAPYTGSDGKIVMQRAVAGDLAETYARLDTCRFTPHLVALAKWCLAPNPADRPLDAQTVASLVELYRLSQEDRVQELNADRTAALDSLVRWSAFRAESHLPRPVGGASNGTPSARRPLVPIPALLITLLAVLITLLIRLASP
jgi:serine/threonine protein kinase